MNLLDSKEHRSNSFLDRLLPRHKNVIRTSSLNQESKPNKLVSNNKESNLIFRFIKDRLIE
jgi:hypothetical protein